MNQAGLLWHYELGEASTRFSWYHLQSDLPHTAGWLADRGTNPSVIEAITAEETRPRAATLAGGTLLVVRGVNLNEGFEPEDMISLRIWFDGNTVITARRKDRPLQSVADVRDQIERNDAPTTIGAFIISLLDGLATRISEAVDDIDNLLTALEDEDAEFSSSQRRMHVAEWRRRTAALRRFIAPQRDALAAFQNLPSGLDQTQRHSVQQLAERMYRFVEELDYARERAMVLSEQLTTEIAEEQNKRVYVLSLVAAIFLPLSYLTGVFGMNVAGLPGTQDSNAFIYVSIGMAAMALLSVLFFWWRRWL